MTHDEPSPSVNHLSLSGPSGHQPSGHQPLAIQAISFEASAILSPPYPRLERSPPPRGLAAPLHPPPPRPPSSSGVPVCGRRRQVLNVRGWHPRQCFRLWGARARGGSRDAAGRYRPHRRYIRYRYIPLHTLHTLPLHTLYTLPLHRYTVTYVTHVTVTPI